MLIVTVFKRLKSSLLPTPVRLHSLAVTSPPPFPPTVKKEEETPESINWTDVDKLVSDNYKLWQAEHGNTNEEREQESAPGNLDSIKTLKRLASARSH